MINREPKIMVERPPSDQISRIESRTLGVRYEVPEWLVIDKSELPCYSPRIVACKWVGESPLILVSEEQLESLLEMSPWKLVLVGWVHEKTALLIRAGLKEKE